MTKKPNLTKLITILVTVLISLSNIPFAETSNDPVRDYLHGSAVQSGNVNVVGAFQTDLFTGSASYAYPIVVPPGTNGLQPQLSIIYNSHSAKQRNGIIGNGWSISQSYIQRDINHTPTDTSDDKFKLFLNGAQHNLVYSGGRYHTEVESYFYIDKLSGGINQKGEYWILKTKDGATYRFGYNSDSELVSNQHNYAVKWSLDLITDTHSNKIYYSYLEDPNANETGTVYPYKIEYNNDKTRVIEFVLESSDKPYQVTFFEQGNKVKYSRRLKEILVKANSELVSKYILEYADIANENSLLSKITPYGKDGISSLPPTEFSYYHNKGWLRNDGYNPPMYFVIREDVSDDPGNSIWVYYDSGARLADLNRNGIIDYVENDYAPEDFMTGYGFDNGMRLGDFNGDGYTDFIIGNSYNNIYKTWLGPKIWWWEDNDTWATDAEFSGVACDNPNSGECYSWDHGTRIADLNGDMIDDIISYGGTLLGSDNGFIETDFWDLPTRFMEYWDDHEKWGDSGLRLADINGDGLPDLLQSNDEPPGNIKKVWINDGTNWYEDDSWAIPMFFIDTKRTDNGIRLVDINGDGLTDILTHGSAYINNGSGWIPDGEWNSPTRFFEEDDSGDCINYDDCEKDNEGVRLGDINGDGTVDIIQSHETKGKATWLSQGGKNFLLKEINDSLGGSTTIDYIESTSLEGNGANFNIWAVSSITKNNGLENSHKISSTLNYDRLGAAFEYQYGEFRGFNYVEEARPDGIKIKHYFHQDKARKGMEYKIEILDSSDNPYKKIENNFSSEDKGEYYVVALNSTTEYDYDGVYEERVIFRWDKPVGQDDPAYANWIAVDKDGDGNLEGYGDTGGWVFGPTCDPEYTFVYTPDGLPVCTNSYCSQITIQYGGKVRCWKDSNEEAEDAVLSSDPIEPYTSNGQEITTCNFYGDCKDIKITHTGFIYDEYGNIIKTSYFGDTSVSGDEKYVYTEFNYDTSKWILNKPKKSYLLDSDDLTKAEETYYSYNSLWDLTKSEYWLDSGSNSIVNYGYDSYGNLISEIDPNGYTTQYEYDLTLTFIVKEINARNHESDYEYDLGTGNLLLITDPNGYRTEYIYDLFGRKIKEILPYDSESSPTVEYFYEFDGITPEKIIIKNKENDQGTLDNYYFYDGLGNLIQSKTESESSQLITNDFYYDELSRLKQESNPYYFNQEAYTNPDASVPKISYEFDALDRTTRIVNPDDTERNIIYDHWTVSIFDENNYETDYINDAYGNIILVKEYDGGNIYSTNYNYDISNNLIQIQDNQGNIIRYTYDTLGRKTNLIDPDLGSWNYYYDKAGNLIKQIDAKNNAVSMNYDELNRIINKSASSVINFYYDENITRTISRIVGPIETTYYDYDNRLRKIKKRDLIDGIEFISEWTYDSMDRVISKKLPDNTIINYDYNDQGGLGSISDVVTSMDYNENNMVTDRTYNNSISTIFNYSQIDYRLLNIKTGNLQDLGYSYDYVGNILTKEDLINDNQEFMQYDDRNQLVKVEKENMDNDIMYNISYSYDTIGNLLSMISNLYNLTLNYSAHAPILIKSSRINLDSSFVIPLVEGWNLISAPLKNTDNTVSATFENGEKILTFDNINKKWIEVEDNEIIDTTKGYWIKSNYGIIELKGLSENQMIDLYEGLNLIGYPSLTAKNINLVFEDINNSLINVLSYENDSWFSYNPLKQNNDLEIMKPGYGYWVNVNDNVSLEIQ